jgi:hypothetical protein
MAIFTAAKAAGTWTCTVSAKYLSDGETLKVGARTYRFKTTTAAKDDIFLSAVSSVGTRAAIASLIAIVNGTGTIAASGADGYTGSVKHESVKATASGTDAVIFTALMPGAVGNQISFVDSTTCGAVDAATLGTTTTGSGSAHTDLNTWFVSLRDNMQINAQVREGVERVIRELT